MVLLCPSHMVPKRCHMVGAPGFKSQSQSFSDAPFPTPLTIAHSCQHSRIFPALLSCHSKSRQAWPCGVEPIISNLSRKLCNQEELPPSYIMGWSHSHPPGSKHGHSYLTYLWNQLKITDTLNYRSEVICKIVAIQNNSQWPCFMHPILQLRLVGVRTSYIYIYIYFFFPPYYFLDMEFWTPLQIPICPSPLSCILLHCDLQGGTKWVYSCEYVK